MTREYIGMVDNERFNRIIEEDILKVCDSNLLSFNISTTMSFKCSLSPIAIGEENVNETLNAKFLGLCVGNKLSFQDHIVKLCNKLSKGWYALRVISRDFNKDFARMVYFSLLESPLRYGICFWGNCSQYLLNGVFCCSREHSDTWHK